MELQKKTRIKSNSNNDKKYRNWDNNDDQDLIDESKFLSEVDLKLLSEENHTRFFAYDWRYYIKVDRNSCNSCNKEFTFNLFRENIQRLLDGTNVETVGFKTAQKFIDVFLNV